MRLACGQDLHENTSGSTYSGEDDSGKCDLCFNHAFVVGAKSPLANLQCLAQEGLGSL